MNDLSEKEQIDAIRAWWKENGNYVVGGVIIGIVTIFGWKQYEAHVSDEQVAASVLFEDVMGATGRGNIDAAVEAAARLFSEHEGTAYAGQARLALARLYMDNGRDEDAAGVLREVVASDPDKAITLVARLRLAKILLYQDKAQEVVGLLEGQADSAFAARFSEALGDAYFALGDFARAETAYFAALNDDPAAPTVDRNLVQLKINDLPSLAETAPAPAGEGAEDTGAGPAADADAAPETGAGETPREEAGEASGEESGEAPVPEAPEAEGGEAN